VKPLWRPTRRTFVRGLGGAAIALPLVASRQARGETPIFPRRLVVLVNPNGVQREHWFPTATQSETSFTVGPSLAPIEPFRDRMVMLSGIDLASAQVGPGEPHQKGMGSLLTGMHLQEGVMIGGDGSRAGWAAGTSIDQLIATALGPTTRFPSLVLGVRASAAEVRGRISYAAPGMPLSPQNDPQALFAQLFARMLTPPMEAGTERHRQHLVLGAVREQLMTVMRNVSSGDRQKLGAHLDLVRDLEVRLDLAAPASGTCGVPSDPPTQAVDDENTMPSISRLQIDQLVSALACDLTRVVTLQYSSAINAIRFPFIGSMAEGHGLSHAGSTDTDAQVQLAARDQWYATEVAYLLGRLAAVPEGDGTLLDNTVVFWGNELAQGNTHSQVSMPWLLFGGAALGLRGGRYLQFDGASHNDLLIALMHLAGFPVDVVGNPEFCHGPLPGLLA